MTKLIMSRVLPVEFGRHGSEALFSGFGAVVAGKAGGMEAVILKACNGPWWNPPLLRSTP